MRKLLPAAVIAFFLAAALLVLLGCSSAPKLKYAAQYPGAVQVSFISYCENAGASPGACGCAIRWWMGNVPYQGFLADERQAAQGIQPADLNAVTAACKNQLGGTDGNSQPIRAFSCGRQGIA